MSIFSRLSKFWHRMSASSGLAAVALLANLLVLPFSQVSASNDTSATPTSSGVAAQRIGPTAASRQLKLAIGLKVTSQAGLDQFLDDIYNPGSANYKHYLSSQEFTQRFTSQADRTVIDSYLQGQGFSVTDSGLGVLINATGTVAQAEKTFGVTISDYQDTQTGKIFYRNDNPVVLPQALASRVSVVSGLSNNNHFYPRTMRLTPDKVQPKANGSPGGCQAAIDAANAYDSFTPNQLKTAYNFSPFYSQNITGTGQTVAVYELDDYVANNIAQYQSCFGTSVPLQRIPVDGGVSKVGDGQNEVELDIEVIAGMAPGLSKILVYEADGSGSSYLDEFQKIANDDLAQVVSISWGDCEGDLTTGFLDSENTIFQQMATQGQSVFSASGDYGAQGCLPINGDRGLWASDILDTPYVTGVGGTRLTLNNDNSINTEITWNDFDIDPQSAYGASAGGVSTYFARPSWQVGPGTNGKYANGKRMTPDVSATASPYTSYVVYTVTPGGSAWQAIGGTSASSPLWAAAAALTNNYLTTTLSQPVLGFANPTIYRIFNSAGNLMTYRDITVGDNCYDATTTSPPHTSTCGVPNSGTGIYPATRGYDMATGVGTLNAYNFARNSCMLNVTSSGDGAGNGTLRTVATSAGQTNAACKMIALNSAQVGSSTITLTTGLTISGGVTLIGPNCGNNGPAFNITGSGTGSLTLMGGGLYGVKVSGFGGPQVVAKPGGNYLGCVKASKS